MLDSPLVELFGKDAVRKNSLGAGRLRSFKSPGYFQCFSLYLLFVGPDVSSQLVFQHHACLPVAMLPIVMVLDSSPLKL